MKNCIIALLSTLFIFNMFYCSEKNNVEYTIQNNENIKYIHNGNKPIEGYFYYDLSVDLTIGNLEGDVNYQLNLPADYEILDNGDIYILDCGNKNVKVFDKKGMHLMTFGKEGRGPGELLNPNSLVVYPDKRIMILDNGNARITLYDSLGNFINDFRIKDGNYLSGLRYNYLNKKEILLANYKIDNNGKKYMALVKYSINGEFKLKIGDFPAKNTQKIPIKFNNGSETVASISLGYEPYESWCLGSDSVIYVGFGNEYKISAYSLEGKLLHVFTKNYEQIKITKNEINKIMKSDKMKKIPVYIKDKIIFPKYKPAFWSIAFVDEQNNIWIKIPHNKEINGEYFFDIFNSKGLYKRQVFFKENITLVKNDYAFGFSITEDGLHVFKRFQIKNKIKVKE